MPDIDGIMKNNSASKDMPSSSQVSDNEYSIYLLILDLFYLVRLFNLSFLDAQNSVNPFERPGSRQAKVPPVIRPAPPPPAPKAIKSKY